MGPETLVAVLAHLLSFSLLVLVLYPVPDQGRAREGRL